MLEPLKKCNIIPISEISIKIVFETLYHLKTGDYSLPFFTALKYHFFKHKNMYL